MARDDRFEYKAKQILENVKDEIDWINNDKVSIVLDGDDLYKALYNDKNALQELGIQFLDALVSYSGTEVFDEVVEEYWEDSENEEEEEEDE